MSASPHTPVPAGPRRATAEACAAGDALLGAMATFVGRSGRLLVLTGAGCSTESGIPDYRDRNGGWKRPRPVLLQEFLRSQAVRRRYWARSLIGWARVERARPNAAHRALARLEQAGLVHWLITQNVDGLHQKAGSRRVIDLHGRLDAVECLGCRGRSPRAAFQAELLARNPTWAGVEASTAPDGDVELDADFSGFEVPACAHCGGVLKPAVVFYGECVPRRRTERAFARLRESEALLVVGSSLMVWSGYRFARAAADRGLPIGALNLGETRADAEIALKLEACCADALPRILGRLGLRAGA